MSGAVSSATGLSVTSWGYADVDGEQWRKWRVFQRGKLVAEVTVRPHLSAVDVLIICHMGTDVPVDVAGDDVPTNDETPGPIPQGDQAGGASAPRGGEARS